MKLRREIINLLWLMVSRAPWVVIGCALALTVAGAVYSAMELRLNSDQDALVSDDVPFQRHYKKYLKNFGDQEYIFVVADTHGAAGAKDQAKAFARSLAARLEAAPDLIRSVHYRITAKDLGDGALYFAPLHQARDLAETVEHLAPSLAGWMADPTLARFFSLAGDMMSGGGGMPASEMDPAMFEQAMDAVGSLMDQVDKGLAGKETEFAGLDLEGGFSEYFFTSNGRLLIMRVMPAKDFGAMVVVDKPLAFIREQVAELAPGFKDIEVGVTGRPVLAADEMSTTDKDMTRASLIAVALVGLLFMVVLHGWARPLLVILALAMAIAWTFGFATLALGELNLLSIVFALVLVGIGVDFGVHIVMRYVEGRMQGYSVDDAVRVSIQLTGPGVTLGAVTSVCAFYAVLFSDFRGIAQLGLVGGTGILFCLLSMLTVLPAMLLIAGRLNLFPSSRPRLAAMPAMERLTARPLTMLCVLGVLSLALAPMLKHTALNYNLLELQAEGLESVKYEHLLLKESDESTWYGVFTAPTMERAEVLAEAARRLPDVGRVETISDYLPTRQEEKAAIFAPAAKALEAVPAPPANLPPPDGARLATALKRFASALEDLQEKLFAAGAGKELARLGELLGAVEDAVDMLEQDPARARSLAPLQRTLADEIGAAVSRLDRMLHATEVGLKDVPGPLRDLFVGKNGEFQVKVMPSVDIWDFENMTHFVASLRAIDPDFTGTPVNVYEASMLLRSTFLNAAGLTLILVSAILLAYSRSLTYVLFTLLPLSAGILWLLEIMGIFGLTFNLANFFAIPVLIAIGVDAGVHYLARWREMPGKEGLFSTSTPMAVSLSFATTMIGFGGLLLAHHRGLASLGAVMVIGSATCMMGSLLVLPAALKRFGKHMQRRK